MGALIQPYMNSIDVHRELDVIMTNGEISHAITKAAILRPGELQHAFHPDAQPHPADHSSDEGEASHRALTPPSSITARFGRLHASMLA
jgi:hypothetical protein